MANNLNLQYGDRDGRRDIAESWKRVEAEQELQKMQADVEMKRKEIEKLAEPNRPEGTTMRMAGDDVGESRLRSEEARRWAAEEASRKTSGREADKTQQIAIAFDNGMEDDRIRKTYRKWCQFYGKQFDENRLDTFAENFLQAERYAGSRGERVQLSAFADLSEGEYKRREEDVARWNDPYMEL